MKIKTNKKLPAEGIDLSFASMLKVLRMIERPLINVIQLITPLNNTNI